MSEPADSTPDELTWVDLVREAFNARPPVPGLGGLPVNWMGLGIFGTLGIFNPGFWLIGAGLEVAYLVAMAQSPRWRNYVRGRRIQHAKQTSAKNWRQRQEQILGALTEPSQERFGAFVDRVEAAKDARAEDELTGLIGDLADDGLHRLRWIYLKLLRSEEVLKRQIDPGTRKELHAELDTYVRKLEALGPEADARIRRSLESTVDILRQRIKNMDTARDYLTYIDSELRRIQHQAELIIEEAALATDADALTSRIDAVTDTFAETQEWMRLHKDLMSDLDIDDDDPGRPPPNRVLAS